MTCVDLKLIAKELLFKKKQLLRNNLTDREQEVGACLIGGMTIKEISNKLGISIYTVEMYKRNIKIRLNSKNSYQVGFLLGRLFNNE